MRHEITTLPNEYESLTVKMTTEKSGMSVADLQDLCNFLGADVKQLPDESVLTLTYKLNLEYFHQLKSRLERVILAMEKYPDAIHVSDATSTKAASLAIVKYCDALIAAKKVSP